MNFKTFLESMPNFPYQEVDYALDWFQDNYPNVTEQDTERLATLVVQPVYDMLMRLRREWGIDYPNEFTGDPFGIDHQEEYFSNQIVISLRHIIESIEDLFSTSKFIFGSRRSFSNLVYVLGNYISECREQIRQGQTQQGDYGIDDYNVFFTQDFINTVSLVEDLFNYLLRVSNRVSEVMGNP